jgi:hypothetical protein
MRGHSPQVAPPVRSPAAGRAEGFPAQRAPPVFTPADRADAVALACALPAETGVPLSKWSCPELARELAARCRCHPTLPPGKARAMRIEHDYKRRGAPA